MVYNHLGLPSWEDVEVERDETWERRTSPLPTLMDALKAELERKKKGLSGPTAERKVWKKEAAPAAPSQAAGERPEGGAPAPPPAAPRVSQPAIVPPLDPGHVVTEKLRSMGEPVRLFGESEAQRRVRACLPPLEGSLAHPSVAAAAAPAAPPPPAAVAEQAPAKEESRKRARVEEEDGSGLAVAGEGGESGGGREEAAPVPLPSSSAPKERRKGSSHLEAKQYAPSQPGGDPHKYLYKFWRGLLSEWEEVLEARPPQEATSPQGQAESFSAAQTAEFMAPFFSLCKSRTVPPDLLPLCIEFVDLLLVREYMAAGDAYLRLSVGKAQWLMGVSQVGLHERAARERIYIGKLPHVLNDETQRRYLTSMKKLMTILQRMKPPADPSKAYNP